MNAFLQIFTMSMTYELSNGLKIPLFGLGTYRLSTNVAQNSVEVALKDGYRLIDTANVYRNEEGVGKGIVIFLFFICNLN